MENKLKSSEQNVKTGKWEIDLNDNSVTLSEVAKLIFGIEVAEITLTMMRNIPLEEYRITNTIAFNALVRENESYNVTYKFKSKTNEIKTINSTATYDKEKKIVYGVIKNITKVTGFVTALLDLDGNILSKSGWRNICVEFHRKNHESAKNCLLSDTILSGEMKNSKQYKSYKCLNGLLDIALPIIINDEHLGNIFTGQFFFENPDREFFIKQAAEYGFNNVSYLAALDEMPVVTEDRVNNVTDFLHKMTELIVDMALVKKEQSDLINALKESEEKYKALYDNAPLSYQSLNEDGTFRDVNPTWLKTLGYEQNEVIGKSFGDFLHPEWKAHFEKNFPAFKSRGYVNDVQFKIRHKDGHYIDISFEGCIGYYPDGSFKQTYCVFKDITDLIKTEQELDKYKNRLEDLVKERTKELEEKNEKLSKYNKLFVDREFRVKELKDKIKELEL
nr:PocR ligand-binding domain-containing protein [Candidatus Delongbacteria bacterium]